MNKKIRKREKKTRKKKNKKNKKRMDNEKKTKKTSLIGWGGYGCVFQPSTNCDGSVSRNKKKKNKISKIQFYGIGGAKNEIFIGKIIHSIPNFKTYFSPIISSCSVLPLHKLDPFVLNNCPSISEKKKHYMDIITTQTRYIKHKPIKLVLKEQDSLLSAYNILMKYIHHLLTAIEILQEKDIIHFDIKDGNILYTYKEKHIRPVIIDFGISFLSSYVYESSDKYIQTRDKMVKHFNTITKEESNIPQTENGMKHDMKYDMKYGPENGMKHGFQHDFQHDYTLLKKNSIHNRFVDIRHLKKRVYFFSPGYIQYPPEVHVIGYLLKYKNEDDLFYMSDIDILSNKIYNEIVNDLFQTVPYISEKDYISEFILYYKAFVNEKKTCYEVCNELYRHVYLWDVYSIYIILFKLGLYLSIHYSEDITKASSNYYPPFKFCLRGLSPNPTKRGSLQEFKNTIQSSSDAI